MPAIQDLRLGDSADRLDGTETIVGRGSGGPGLVVGSPRHGSATSARADHLGRPWRVHALARAESLALHDVWEVDAALPPGATLGQWADALRRERQSTATRALFALRWGLGRVLGLDRASPGFTLVYAEPEEQLHRIDNRTVSAFLHLSLVRRRPRLAVYVRPHGRFGRWYLRGIDPFRRAIVYPSLLAAGRRAAQRLAG